MNKVVHDDVFVFRYAFLAFLPMQMLDNLSEKTPFLSNEIQSS